ncbi:hypothetical protein GFPCMMHI_06708 [Ensifer adhaerens]|nr:hypothetical protein [Ensifer adhaerens]
MRGLISKNRSVGHEERRGRSGQADTNTGKLSRSQEEIGILERGAGMDRTARAVNCVVEEVERALKAIVGFIAQRCFDLVVERAALLLALALERQVILLAHIEVEIDRVERDECGEQRRRAGRSATTGNQATG